MLLEQRVAAKAPSSDMNKTLDHLAATVAERAMVGDVPALEARIEDRARRQWPNWSPTERKANEELRATELAAREAIVAEAEAIAATGPRHDPVEDQGSNRMNDLFDAWKTAQKSGVRLGRSTEDRLWKRFRGARTTFDRHRRAYFSQLDATNAEAKGAKEALIARAEELAHVHRLGQHGRRVPPPDGRVEGLQARLAQGRRRSVGTLPRRPGHLLRGPPGRERRHRRGVRRQPDRQGGTADRGQGTAADQGPGRGQEGAGSIRDRWEAAGKVPRADMRRVEAGAAPGRGGRPLGRGRAVAPIQPGDQGPHRTRC